MLLQGARCSEIKAVISIVARHEYPVEAPVGIRRLELHFDDAEVVNMADPSEAYRAWAQAKWAKEVGRPVTPPGVEDAKAIIEFAREVSEIEGTVLCQCLAGVSRSTAAALICLATWTQEGQEKSCVEELLRVRPCAAPHRGLVEFADTILGRGGRLVEAVDRIRKGG